VVRSGLGHWRCTLWSRVGKLSGNFGFTKGPIGWLLLCFGLGDCILKFIKAFPLHIETYPAARR
jgi:hypothetical protein